MGDATPTSLLACLDERCAASPARQLFTWLDDRGEQQDSLSYGDVDARTRALAARLVEGKGTGGCALARGDRALLVFEPCLSFIIAFLACLRAGVIAVPVFPPDPRRLKKDLFMFASIQKSCSATLALTTSSYNYAKKMADIQSIFSSDAMSWPQMRWEVVEALLASAPRAVAALSSIDDAASVAFLQFTSGSTSAPKGVIISHANLAHNLSLIVRELRASTDTVVVSWLPQYHDMGLIGSYLGALYCGGRGYYMSPFGFIKNPAVWVESISRYRGTHMQAPNFAYSLCARKFSTMRVPPSLDLSCVRHMINAAEPCDERSIDAFVETFTPHGLPADVIFPTYGLAEHTVFVCSGGTQRLRVDKVALESEQRASIAQPGAPDTTAVIGCGYPFRGQGVDVAIVDTDGTRLCEGRVGEIWVRSPSKAGGYWDLPEQSLEDFGATLREPDGSSAAPPADGGGAGYLRTGDLGFLSSGELFICGRIKDLIIVRGRNHYPQDLEKTAEAASDALRPGCSAAFMVTSVQGHDEAVVLIAEVRDDSARGHAAVVDAVTTAISSEHGVTLSRLCLLKQKSVPKTTSGKIARRWCSKALREQTLSIVHEWSSAVSEAGDENAPLNPSPTTDPSTMNQAQLLEKLKGDLGRLTNRDPTGISADTALVELGVDSLALAQLKGQLEGEYGCVLPDEVMFRETTTLRVLTILVKEGFDEETYSRTVAAFEIETVTIKERGGGDPLIENCPCCLLCPCYKTRKV